MGEGIEEDLEPKTGVETMQEKIQAGFSSHDLDVDHGDT